MTSPDEPRPEIPRHRVALLAAAAFCVAACMRLAEPLIPNVAQEFATTPGRASTVATGFALAYGLFQLIHGPFGDRFGKFRAIAIAMILSAVAVAGAASANSLSALALWRFAAGAAAAGVVTLGIAYVGDHVSYETRQPVLARLLTGQLIGVIAGQAAGGVLIDAIGWRPTFMSLAGAFAIVAAMLWREAGAAGLSDRRRPGRLQVGGLARLYLAFVTEAGPRRVLVAIFWEGFLFFGALAYFGAFLRLRFGLPYTTLGLVLGGFGVGGLCYTLFARRIVPSLGERGMLRLGCGVLAAALVAFAVLPLWWTAIPTVLAVGFGFFMVHNTLQTNASQMSAEARGAAVALFNSVFFLGQAAGVALFGQVVDRFGYSPVFIAAAAGMLALGLVFSART